MSARATDVKRSHGLSLAELMVAGLILFVAGTAVALVIGASSRYTSTTRDRCTTLQLAEQQAQEVVASTVYNAAPVAVPSGYSVALDYDSTLPGSGAVPLP